MKLLTLPFSEETITVYNKYQGKDALGKTFTKFLRTVLSDCSWNKSDTTMTVGTTTIGSDDYIIQIPEDTQYRDYSVWAAMPNDLMNLYFSLNAGDVIVRGVAEEEVPDNSSAKVILDKYPNSSFTVKVAYSHSGSGKPLGHYEAKGK